MLSMLSASRRGENAELVGRFVGVHAEASALDRVRLGTLGCASATVEFDIAARDDGVCVGCCAT